MKRINIKRKLKDQKKPNSIMNIILNILSSITP